MPTSVVKTQGLSHRFGKRWALAHVTMEIPSGATLLLAGANGCGKTTLLRCIAGLYRPTRGTVSVLGQDPIQDRLAVRRQLSLISHHHYLYERLTAVETLKLWSDILDHKRTSEDLVELLAKVQLEAHAKEMVGGFSAGMKKRLNLLRWHLESPNLALLDEPFAALDPSGQELVQNWIRSFVEQENGTVVVASHNLGLCKAVCEQALVLRQGQVEWQGDSTEVEDQLRSSGSHNQ